VFFKRIFQVAAFLQFFTRQILCEFQLHIRWCFYITRRGFRSTRVTTENSIVLSMTTYPRRARFAKKAIKSVILQNSFFLPIYIFVFEEEYSRVSHKLSSLSKHNLQVVPYKQNLRQYLKIIPALEQFKNQSIITFDDDILYPHGWLDGLITAYQGNPNTIIGYRGQSIPDKETLSPENYFLLKLFRCLSTKSLAPERILFTGVGGVLYPPKVFCSLVLNMKLALRLSPGNDDLWLYYNSIHNQASKLFIPDSASEPLYFFGSQGSALWKSNDVGERKNNQALIELSRTFLNIQCHDHDYSQKVPL
jgi:hypothetical protein